MFPYDVMYHLENDGVGTLGRDLFLSAKANIPDGPGPMLSLFETGGVPPWMVHGQNPPAYKRPAAQLIGRGTIYDEAHRMISNAYSSLTKVKNQVIGVRARTVSSITRSGTTATVTTTTPHGYPVGMSVTISGATPTDYNGAKTINTVPSATTFTFTVAGSPTTPATGSMGVSFLGTFYLWIRAIQEPFEISLDQSDRARLVFNINAVERPS